MKSSYYFYFQKGKKPILTKPILRNEPELKESFFNPSFLRDFPAIDELLVGLTLTAAQRADDNFSDDVSIHTLTDSP